MTLSKTGFLAAVVLSCAPVFSMSFIPPPVFYPTVPDSDTLVQPVDSLGRAKAGRSEARRILRRQMDSALVDPEYRYSQVRMIYGSERKEHIRRIHFDSVLVDDGYYPFRDLASIENFYGPRFTGSEVHFLLGSPLVFSAIFGLLELGHYAETGRYRWEMPAVPFGLMFGLILPFTLDFDSQMILIK